MDDTNAVGIASQFFAHHQGDQGFVALARGCGIDHHGDRAVPVDLEHHGFEEGGRFVGRVQQAFKGRVSAARLKAMVKELIDLEDKDNPHSDEQLSTRLQAQGADLDRRTVAYYRKELKIPTAAERQKK